MLSQVCNGGQTMWRKKQLLTYSALLFKEMGLSRAASLVMAWCLGASPSERMTRNERLTRKHRLRSRKHIEFNQLQSIGLDSSDILQLFTKTHKKI